MRDRQTDMDQLALERALIAEGMDPREAARTAAKNHLARMQQQSNMSIERTPDGRPKLSDQEAEFDSEMGVAMGQVAYGNGAELDNLSAAATPIVMDEGLGVPQQGRVYRDDPTQGLAGVLAGREEAAAQNWAERAGQYGDPDPAARGMVPTYNQETGEVGYSVAIGKPDETGNIPQGAPGRAGYRPDLMRPVIDSATGQPIQGTNKYTKQLRDGPEGLVEVYAPSPAFRQQLDRRADQQLTRRLATRAGYNPMQAADMATGQTPNLDRLRAQGDAMRDAAKADRQQAVIRRAQAQTNPLEYMNRGDISEWNRFAAAQNVLGGRVRGATPNDVAAARNEQLTALGLRVAQGQGFQQQPPGQEALVAMKVAEAERGVPAEERAPKYRDEPTVHPSEMDMADSYVARMYSGQSKWALGGTITSFSAEEQQATVDWLEKEKGYKPEKARRIVDGIARQRNAQSWFGNFE